MQAGCAYLGTMDTPSIEVPGESLSILWKSMTDEEKRQRIVDAVLSLVAKHGVQWATTARIAATVGVSEPTLYRTFRNRKEMLLAAADEIWEQRHSELESFDSSDAMDFLRKICASHTVGIRTTRVVRFITELAVSHTGDGLREHIRDLQFDNVRRLVEVVEQGKAEGCIRADVDSWETAWSIQTVYWLEAMARLHGLEEHVLTGFSSRRFQAILEDIAGQSLATQSDGGPSDRPAESGRT
jgi:AcrR family transcriptional regulator